MRSVTGSLPVRHSSRHAVPRYLFMNRFSPRRIAGCLLSPGLCSLALLMITPVPAAQISIPLNVPLALLHESLTGVSAVPEQAPRELYRQETHR